MNLLLFNTHDVILLITVYQCLALAVALFLLSKRQFKSGVFVTLFFLANAVTPLDTLISFGDGFHEFAIQHIPNWFYVFEMGYWLEGPFLLWYLRSLVYKNYRLSSLDFWYLAPFLLFFLHQLLAYHSLPTVGKVHLERTHNLANESISVFYLVAVRSGLRLYFGLLCIQEMRRYLASMQQAYASFNDSAFLWVRILVYGFVALWGWALLVSIGLVINHYRDLINVGIMGLTANYVLCFLLGAVLVAICVRSGSIEQTEYMDVNDKVAPNTLVDPADVLALEEALLGKKLFTDPVLSLDSLAKHLGWSSRALSSLIHKHYQCNFYELVNKYRVEEAKALILAEENKNVTMLDLMYEAGFNSKTTFNASFKKHTGLTPREFKKQAPEFAQLNQA